MNITFTKLITPAIIVVVLLFIFLHIGPKINHLAAINNKSNIPIDKVASEWKTYTNTKYGFQIEHPENWLLYELDNKPTPVIVFYTTKKPVVSFRDNATVVAIYPKGFPSHGIGVNATSSSIQISTVHQGKDYILSNLNTSFATQLKFPNPLNKNWSDDGFIVGRLYVNDFIIKCELVKNTNQDECSPIDGDRFVAEGTAVDENNRSVVERMLKSFKFTQ